MQIKNAQLWDKEWQRHVIMVNVIPLKNKASAFITLFYQKKNVWNDFFMFHYNNNNNNQVGRYYVIYKEHKLI